MSKSQNQRPLTPSDETTLSSAFKEKFGTAETQEIAKELEAKDVPIKHLSTEEFAEKSITAILGPEEDLPPEKNIKYQDYDLSKQREQIMKHWPEGIALRGRYGWDEKKGKYRLKNRSNLDGEACLFFFRYILGFRKDVGENERNYINKKTKYVFPGEYLSQAINLDTSWGTHGAELDMDEMALAIDHHAVESSRDSSVFKILYEQYKKDGLLDRVMLDEKEKKALKCLVDFVTAVDNYNIPSGLSWETLWKTADRNLFAICVNQQYSVKIERLFDFFKKNKFEDAFSSLSPTEINKILGPAAHDEQEKRSSTFVERQRDNKEKVREFLKKGKGQELDSSHYGRILLVLGELMPGSALACFGNGFDALLVWQPAKKSFFFNVRPGKEIPHSLRDELGENQAVWVRGEMLLQPDWRSKKLGLEKFNFSFDDLLVKLGVDTSQLDKEAVEEILAQAEKEQAAKAQKKQENKQQKENFTN